MNTEKLFVDYDAWLNLIILKTKDIVFDYADEDHLRACVIRKLSSCVTVDLSDETIFELVEYCILKIQAMEGI